MALKEATVLQVILDDHICHRPKNESNVARVRGAREVCVDFFRIPVFVQALKFEANVGRSRFVRVGI